MLVNNSEQIIDHQKVEIGTILGELSKSIRRRHPSSRRVLGERGVPGSIHQSKEDSSRYHVLSREILRVSHIDQVMVM